MALFLVASCGIDTTTMTTTTSTSEPSTTTTTTAFVPVRLSRSETIAALDRYADRILPLTAYYPGGDPFPDDVASMTFLRSQLEPMPISTGTSFLNDTWVALTDLSAWLSGCDETETPLVCDRLVEEVQGHLRVTVVDGWLKIEFLRVQTFVVGPTVRRVLTYDGLELDLVSEDIAFRHLTVGPQEDPLNQPETLSQTVYQENGDVEYLRWTPLTLTKTTQDNETGIVTTVSMDPLNRLSVRKWFLEDGMSFMGSFESPQSLSSITVGFGTDTRVLQCFVLGENSDLITLEYNALFVGGWDQLRFDEASNAALYLGDTKIAGDFFVDADVWNGHTDATLFFTMNLSELDDSVLSLSTRGLTFEEVTMTQLPGALMTVRTSGVDWIVEEGLSFDRDENIEFLRGRIVVAIDEAWIASFLEN
jgi:hypothetical protein